MNWAHRALLKVSGNLLHAAVNFDRMCASLGGAPVDYTLSGEAGKHEGGNFVAHDTAVILDHIQRNHVEVAYAEDQAITDARAKFEAK